MVSYLFCLYMFIFFFFSFVPLAVGSSQRIFKIHIYFKYSLVARLAQFFACKALNIQLLAYVIILPSIMFLVR